MQTFVDCRDVVVAVLSNCASTLRGQSELTVVPFGLFARTVVPFGLLCLSDCCAFRTVHGPMRKWAPHGPAWLATPPDDAHCFEGHCRVLLQG